MENPILRFEDALDQAHLTLENLDLLHANLIVLIEQLQTYHLWEKLLEPFADLLMDFEQSSRQAIEKTADSSLSYGSNGQLLPCPACGSLSLTTLKTQNDRPCCRLCGLPHAFY